MKIMVNSIPKGGTHLLMKLVYLLGIRDDPRRFWLGAGQIKSGFETVNKIVKGSFTKPCVTIGSEVPVRVGTKWLERKIARVPDGHSFGAHCRFSQPLLDVLNRNRVRVVCIIRDPRAIAASHFHYIKQYERHFYHNEYMALSSDRERLRFSISGGTLGKYTIKSLVERYNEFQGWAMEDSVALVRFEDLIGEKGGGSSANQRVAIERVANALSVETNEKTMEFITNELFGESKKTRSDTFRKGQVGSWRTELDRDLQQFLKLELSATLQQWDYRD